MENCINDCRPKIGNEIGVAGTALLLAGVLMVSEMSGELNIENGLSLHETSASVEETSANAEEWSVNADTLDKTVTAEESILQNAVTTVSVEEIVVEENSSADVWETVEDNAVSDVEYTIGIGSDVIMPDAEWEENIGSDVIVPDADYAGDIGNDVIVPDTDNESDGSSDIIVPEDNAVVPGEDDTADDPAADGETEQIPESLNGFLIDGEGMIYGIDSAAVTVADGYLELPSEGCIGVRSGALTEFGAGIAEVYIPGNISVIEEGAFSELYLLEWIEAAPGNPGCMSADGVLFDAGGTTLLAFPGQRTDMYMVPAGVTRIASGAFAYTGISRIDFWQCGTIEIGTNVFGEGGGNGIEVRAPEENVEWYQDVFAGYNVQIL